MKEKHRSPQDLITTEEAARLLGVSTGTLEMRRVAGLPPRWYKLGPGVHSHVRYSRRDVQEYLAGCLRDPDAAHAGRRRD